LSAHHHPHLDTQLGHVDAVYTKNSVVEVVVQHVGRPLIELHRYEKKSRTYCVKRAEEGGGRWKDDEKAGRDEKKGRHKGGLL
jgi:hypothetical protein